VTADPAIAIVVPGTVSQPPVDNGPPLSANDTATAVSGSPATIDVLANDTAPNPPLSLRFVAPIGRSGGAARVSGNSVAYTSPQMNAAYSKTTSSKVHVQIQMTGYFSSRDFADRLMRPASVSLIVPPIPFRSRRDRPS